jgi:hypothetical protein
LDEWRREDRKEGEEAMKGNVKDMEAKRRDKETN